jgi:hypothetical protein
MAYTLLIKKYLILALDPIHTWRSKSGIELIHREPTRKELKRILQNWNKMTQFMQDLSDTKSYFFFKCDNRENYKKLIRSYDVI